MTEHGWGRGNFDENPRSMICAPGEGMDVIFLNGAGLISLVGRKQPSGEAKQTMAICPTRDDWLLGLL